MEKKIIIGVVVINFILMGIVDAVLVPPYMMKSCIKVVLFACIPLLYYRKNKELKDILTINKKGLKESLLVGSMIIVVIVGGYFLFRNIFDFSNITTSLSSDIGVNVENFLFVSMYITFVNSFLEEFFFRGFAFLTLGKYTGIKFSCVFSSLVFALYHVAMMVTWVSPLLVVLAVAGLFIGGLIFNYFNYRYHNIYASWIIHMFSNIAINCVGFILFLG